MTTEEFNKKYKDYLADRFYGLYLSNEKVIEYLDNKFQDFITRPDFKYHQIKLKFGMARFYAEGISTDEMFEIEGEINKIHNAAN